MGEKAKPGDKRIGNQFWKLRSKHGRDKLFKTPDLLWEAATEYFQWCDDNPFKKQEAIKSGDLAGTTMDVEVMRPYTLMGFCLYVECSENYFRNFQSNNKDAKDFMAVLDSIEKTIYNQKFSGAASGFLNANIIARDLGLADKKEHSGEIKTGGYDILP